MSFDPLNDLNCLNDSDVVIVSAARTPMGGFQGELASLTAPQLGAVAIRGAINRTGIDAEHLSQHLGEVLLGNVLSAGVGQAPARQAALAAGVDQSVPCTTISKVCGSGMKAVMIAFDQIKAQSSDAILAGGMESMSQSPYILPKARQGLRIGHAKLNDHMFTDGLEDAYTGRAMGTFAQATADARGLTREQQDEYAVESLSRANGAIDQGYFNEEIETVTVTSRTGQTDILIDEQPGKAKPQKIFKLKPAFAENGTITAANSSSISDGAAALLLMSVKKAKSLNLSPLARILAHTTYAQHPSEFTIAPVNSIQKLLDKVSWSIEDVDLFEINEAFAMVTMLAIQDLNIDYRKVNVNGGACALGHPLGASGARIIVTLIHALKRLGKKTGVASLCLGGGEATAIAIEML